MLLRSFLDHNWKEKIRSPFWQKSIWINILLGFLILYLLINFILLGLFTDRILSEIFPGEDLLKKFSELLLYYFLIDLFIRFFVQNLPTISIAPYLHLPVKKNSIFHYLLIKSAFNLLNLFPLLIIVPFFIKVTLQEHSSVLASTWILTICMLILSNNYFNFFIKKSFTVRPILSVAILAGVALLLYLEFSGIFSASFYFGFVVIYIANHPALVLIPVIIFLMSYYVSLQLLNRNAHLEDLESSAQKDAARRSFSFFERYGKVGHLIQLEIKMILRNTRPKTILFISVFFLFYGFIFYGQEMYADNYYFLIGIGIFLTGLFSINHGQFMFSWESSYFDFLLTKNINISDLFTLFYRMYFVTNLIAYILTLPYALFDSKIALVNSVALLFNQGFNIHALIYMGLFNTKRIDLTKGAFFNYEGVGVTQFLLIFLIIAFPLLIFMPFSMMDMELTGLFVLALIGLTGIVLHKSILEKMIRIFENRKYKMASGFRKL